MSSETALTLISFIKQGQWQIVDGGEGAGRKTASASNASTRVARFEMAGLGCRGRKRTEQFFDRGDGERKASGRWLELR